jgi:hypothetical protein
MTTQTEELRAPIDTFAVRLVIARHHCGDISQEKAAALCGLKASTWATWERGVRPHNMGAIVSKISNGLALPREWLMWGGPLRPETFQGPDPGVRKGPTLMDALGVSTVTRRLLPLLPVAIPA